jgi:hypothetical protein
MLGVSIIRAGGRAASGTRPQEHGRRVWIDFLWRRADHALMSESAHMQRLWDTGQRLLAGARYVPARSALELAESIAWRRRDAASLARLYLPLLEARRQIRYHAAEGLLVICNPGGRAREEKEQLDRLLRADAGTVLLTCSAGEGEAACRFAGSVQYAARRTGHWLEALILVRLAGDVRVASQADPLFAAGLAVEWTRSAEAQVGASTDPRLVVPLPPPGVYSAREYGALHAVARESLITAWEALALKWQRRHPPPAMDAGASGAETAWEELAWLRLALRVDPACEPVTMRLIAVAEAIERSLGRFEGLAV